MAYKLDSRPKNMACTSPHTNVVRTLTGHFWWWWWSWWWWAVGGGDQSQGDNNFDPLQKLKFPTLLHVHKNLPDCFKTSVAISADIF